MLTERLLGLYKIHNLNKYVMMVESTQEGAQQSISLFSLTTSS